MTFACIMQAASSLQQELLQRSWSPNNLIDSSRSQTADASLIQDGNSVAKSDDSCKGRQSNLTSQDGEEVPHSKSLQGLSGRNRAMKPESSVFTRKAHHGSGHLPARSHNQKSHILHVPVDKKDLHKFYQQPKFTLRDFIVEFASASEESVSVGETKFTDCGLQKVLEEKCEPRNTELSTQQLHLPDDLPEVCKRVPPKQLLIEMAAVIREQLHKVVLCEYICFSVFFL